VRDDGLVTATVEFTIEPFVEGSPGPHVLTAIAAIEEAGLEVEVGPFGTLVTGETDEVVSAAAVALSAAARNGATRISLQLTFDSGS